MYEEYNSLGDPITSNPSGVGSKETRFSGSGQEDSAVTKFTGFCKVEVTPSSIQ